jgi:hypothetical protein
MLYFVKKYREMGKIQRAEGSTQKSVVLPKKAAQPTLLQTAIITRP